MRVTEIFKSIQGESSFTGLPFVFVRLAGCNLRCAWCDTTYAWEGGESFSVEEIVRQVEAFNGTRVLLTGGEPLLQEDTPMLAEALLARGLRVCCETNGSLPIDRLPQEVIRIMDIKCPSSGMTDRMDWSNVERLTKRDEVKFVVADSRDYAWARDCCRRNALSERCGEVLFSPVTGSDQFPPEALARHILEDNLDVRMQVQLHKVIWGPSRRGV